MRSRRFSPGKASPSAAMSSSPTTLPAALSSKRSISLSQATDTIRSTPPTTHAAQPLRFSYSGSPPSPVRKRSRVPAAQIPPAVRNEWSAIRAADIAASAVLPAPRESDLNPQSGPESGRCRHSRFFEYTPKAWQPTVRDATPSRQLVETFAKTLQAHRKADALLGRLED